jgi:transposase-like protein
MYLFRAVDSYGQTVDFYLSETRAREAAKRFLSKALAIRTTGHRTCSPETGCVAIPARFAS